VFGLDELKQIIEVTEATVECPVKDCDVKVERQRRRFKRENRFYCPNHDIFISPSTFEYQNMFDHLLWKTKQDIDLLNNISKVKRESRMARDNSEDAVTWNVFRFLEQNELLAGLLKKYTNSVLRNPEIIYWPYSQSEKNVWSQLIRARTEFEINPEKGSEPDIIVKSDNTLFFIEAKLLAGNKTELRSKNPTVQKKYETGGNNWFSKVFNSKFKTVAEVNKKYELLRFWLLGTWIAEQHDLDFHLVNLVLSEREKNIESIFKEHIKENEKRKFLRMTWEDIFGFILKSPKESKAIVKYFRNKTIGYDRDGRLRQAFSQNHF